LLARIVQVVQLGLDPVLGPAFIAAVGHQFPAYGSLLGLRRFWVFPALLSTNATSCRTPVGVQALVEEGDDREDD
jgi:hypothetical protein